MPNQINSNYLISIIIPVKDEYDISIWNNCIGSIYKLNPTPLECIIVIDGDNDILIKKAKEKNISVYKTGIPSGPSIARNMGAKYAKGELILFIDYDVIVPSNLILQIQNIFKADSSLSALFGSYDSKPSDQSVISQYRNLLHHYVHQTSNREAHTFWAGCGAIKKNIFDHLKGFDGEKYKMPSIEDIELGYRLAKHGYNINLLKEIQVTHQKKWTLSNMVKTDLFNRAIPWTKLILKEKAFYNDLNIKNKDIYSIAMVFVLFLSLIYSFFNLMAIGVVFLTFLIFFMLNFGFYGFLKNLKGLGFALKAIPLHILFYIICGTGFIIGTLEYYISKSNES